MKHSLDTVRNECSSTSYRVTQRRPLKICHGPCIVFAIAQMSLSHEERRRDCSNARMPTSFSSGALCTPCLTATSTLHLALSQRSFKLNCGCGTVVQSFFSSSATKPNAWPTLTFWPFSQLQVQPPTVLPPSMPPVSRSVARRPAGASKTMTMELPS